MVTIERPVHGYLREHRGGAEIHHQHQRFNSGVPFREIGSIYLPGLRGQNHIRRRWHSSCKAGSHLEAIKLAFTRRSPRRTTSLAGAEWTTF